MQQLSRVFWVRCRTQELCREDEAKPSTAAHQQLTDGDRTVPVKPAMEDSEALPQHDVDRCRIRSNVPVIKWPLSGCCCQLLADAMLQQGRCSG